MHSIFDEYMLYQYLICTYASLLYLMGRDLMPRGNVQIVFGAYIDAFGQLVVALLFAQLAVLVIELQDRSYNLEKNMTTAKRAMMALGVP